MRLIFRHLLRSIKKSPVQTLVLLLTVFLSAVLFCGIFEVSVALATENDGFSKSGYGNAQISVTAQSGENSNFLTASRLRLSEEQASVCGILPLPSYVGEGEQITSVLGAATDFYTVDDVFLLDFVQIENVDSDKISRAVYLSERFAKNHGLRVGDALAISLLGEQVSFTIKGINRYAFFDGYEFIIDARGALNVLSKISPTFAVFDEGDAPYQKILVRARDEGQVQSLVLSLNERLNGLGWTASEVVGYYSYLNSVIALVLTVIVLFSAILAGILLHFTLNIMAEKRKNQTQTLYLSGASPKLLLLGFAIELFIYLFIGTGLGVGVSAFVLPTFGTLSSMQYAQIVLSPVGIAVCAGAELVSGAVSFLLYALSSFRRKPPRLGGKTALVSALIVVICAICALCVPPAYALYFSVAAILPAFFALVVGLPALLKVFARLLAPKLERGTRGVYCSLALKNCYKISPLHDVLRILSVVASAVLVLCACFHYGDHLVYDYHNTFDCDYIALGSGVSVSNRIAAVEGTTDSTPCFFAIGQGEGAYSFFLADCPKEGYLLDQTPMPEGKGIVLPKAVARLFGVGVGDKLCIKLFGTEYEFTVSGFGAEDGRLCFINAAAHGMEYNYTLVRAEGGGGYLSRLSSALSVYGITVQQPSALFAHNLSFVDVFFTILKMFVIGVCAISFVAVCNLVTVSYLRRREQFNSLKLLGATKDGLALTVATEGGVLLLLALLSCLAVGGALCGFLDLALCSFGFRLF